MNKKRGKTKKVCPLNLGYYNINLKICQFFKIYAIIYVYYTLGGIFMKKQLKFRWLIKVPFWTRLHLMTLCYDLLSSDDFDQIELTKLFDYFENEHNIKCSMFYCKGTTTFTFSPNS